MSLVVIIELIPVSISGVGTRDAFLIFVLGLIGIGKESAIAFSLLYLLTYWFLGLIGFFFWVKEPVKLKLI